MTTPLQFSVDVGQAAPKRRKTPAEPLRILVLSDLGASCASRQIDLAARPMRKIDIDLLDDLLNAEAPELDLPSGSFAPKEMDDFHADELCKSMPIFRTLKDLRSQLRSPATFDSAAQEVRALLQSEIDSPNPEAAPCANAESDTDTLSRLLGQAPQDAAQATPADESSGYLDRLLKDVVADHIFDEASPQADHYISALDAAAAAHLRAALHDPEFQALEAAWRGLDLLVSHIETDEDLSIHVWNVSTEELTEALGPERHPLDQTALHRRIADDHEDAPFSLIVTDMVGTASDLRLLASLGALAGRTGAAVVTGIAPALVGAASWAAIANAPEALSDPDEHWSALRDTPMGEHIVALGPRFLLRAPYGKRRDPVDTFFEFDEMPDPESGPEALLWGNSSLLAAVLIARAFRDGGWNTRLSANLTYGDLPLVTYSKHGDPEILPCAEVLMADRVGEAVLATGAIPVMAARNQNAVRLPRFQTIRHSGGSRIGPFSA
jgi:type VI secretion system ImpC/EvpB family protein